MAINFPSTMVLGWKRENKNTHVYIYDIERLLSDYRVPTDEEVMSFLFKLFDAARVEYVDLCTSCSRNYIFEIYVSGLGRLHIYDRAIYLNGDILEQFYC